jgi:hypothetical protein
VVPGSKVEVVSLSGVRLATTTAVAEGQTVVNVSKLPAGVYLLRAGGTTVKFIKK